MNIDQDIFAEQNLYVQAQAAKLYSKDGKPLRHGIKFSRYKIHGLDLRPKFDEQNDETTAVAQRSNSMLIREYTNASGETVQDWEFLKQAPQPVSTRELPLHIFQFKEKGPKLGQLNVNPK